MRCLYYPVGIFAVLLALLFAPIPTVAGLTEDLNEVIGLLNARNTEKAKTILLRIVEAQGATDSQRAYAYFFLAECFRGTPEALRYNEKAVGLNPKGVTIYSSEASIMPSRHIRQLSARDQSLGDRPCVS